MRKKLEKGAINQLKSRIAQQNRQAGSKNAPPPMPDPNQDNNDSDMDPNDKNDVADVNVGGSTAVNPT